MLAAVSSQDFQSELRGILANRAVKPSRPITSRFALTQDHPNLVAAACPFGSSSGGDCGSASSRSPSSRPLVRGSRVAEFLKQINQNEEAKKPAKANKTPGRLNVTLNIPMPCPGPYARGYVPPVSKGIASSQCSICKEEVNGEGPDFCQLECGHKFHTDCVQQLVSNAPQFGARFLMTYLRCPECRSVMRHPQFDALVVPYQEKFERVLNALEKYGGEAEQRLVQSGVARLREDLFDDFLFYLCACCGQPFFGGRKECQVEGAVDDTEPSKDRICVACQARMHNIDLSKQNASCIEHGTEFIAFKCKFCCRVAVWFCGGTTHFCEPCHRMGWGGVFVQPCNCGNSHSNGQEQCLGCVLCQSL